MEKTKNVFDEILISPNHNEQIVSIICNALTSCFPEEYVRINKILKDIINNNKNEIKRECYRGLPENLPSLRALIWKINFNIIFVMLEEIFHQRIIGSPFYKFIDFFISKKLYEIIDINNDQADIHQCKRKRSYSDGVGHGDHTSDCIDHPQFHNGGHQHGNHNKCRPDITNYFQNHF